MEKSRLKNFVLLISIILLFTNCGYKFLREGEKSIFVMPVENLTLTPQMDIYLNSEIRRVFIQNPHFILSSTDGPADIILKIRIIKTSRQPLFYASEDSSTSEDASEIITAKFYIEAEMELLKEGSLLLKETISETIAFSLSVGYQEEDVLKSVSEKFASKVYFWMIEKNEKGVF